MIKLPPEFDYIEMHDKLEKAITVLQNTDKHMCITGMAGSGKTEFIKMCCNKSFYNHSTVVCCPTGVAAVNASSDGIKATTIHSLFRLPAMSIIPINNLSAKEDLIPLFTNLHTLIIDEIGAVNSDLLTKIVYMIRQYTNGVDVRLILIGDPSQLSPIIKTKEEKSYVADTYGSKFFFHATPFIDLDFEIIAFNKVFRQRDTNFVNVLNSFRFNTLTPSDLSYMNTRVMTEAEFRALSPAPFIHIALTNKTVNGINSKEMRLNPTKSRCYYGTSTDFPDEDKAVPNCVELKKGAQVMVCANDHAKGYYNGMLGIVTSMYDSAVVIEVNGKHYTIERYTWQRYTHNYNKDKKEITATSSGEYKQIPLKLGYALTAHKTQGLTLDRAFVNLEKRTFASGMCYTSISRTSSLEGLGLARPIRVSDNKLSFYVKQFYKRNKLFNTNNRRKIVCKYCESSGWRIHVDDEDHVQEVTVSACRLNVFERFRNIAPYEQSTSIEIKFCPFCGRELKEEE